MLTKLPDYIISDCGYPDWSVEEKENIKFSKMHAHLWHTSSIWSTKPSNFVRLLPLRETVTDYYVQQLMVKQKEHMQKKLSQYNTTTKNHCGRPMPKQVNELINNAKRKQLQQCILDKRRSHANNSENDLDQF